MKNHAFETWCFDTLGLPLLPVNVDVLVLQPSKKIVFYDYEILVVLCSQRASFHEWDKPDHSSFGQNTHGHNDRLSLAPLPIPIYICCICL